MAQQYDKSSKLINGNGLGFPTQKKNFSTLGKTANAKSKKSKAFQDAASGKQNIDAKSGATDTSGLGFPTENRLFSTLGKPSTNKDYTSEVFEQALTNRPGLLQGVGAGLSSVNPAGPSLQTDYNSTTIGVHTGTQASDTQLTGDTWYLLSENYNYERFIIATEDGDLILWIN